jgi:hypothetical protein
LIVSRFYVSGVETEQDRKSLDEITRDFFAGCTIIQATGFWHNTKEKTYIIEVAGGPSLRKKKEYALRLATQFKQECVMIMEWEAVISFISPEGN